MIVSWSSWRQEGTSIGSDYISSAHAIAVNRAVQLYLCASAKLVDVELFLEHHVQSLGRQVIARGAIALLLSAIPRKVPALLIVTVNNML
jgi:hypothetical protein